MPSLAEMDTSMKEVKFYIKKINVINLETNTVDVHVRYLTDKNKVIEKIVTLYPDDSINLSEK